MRLKLLVIAIWTCWAAAPVNASDRSVIYGRGYRMKALPTFDKGYLLFIDRWDGIEVWGPDGRLVFQTMVSNPPEAHIATAAVDTNGTVAVGLAYSGPPYGHQGGIAFLDRSGRQLRFVETGRYMPAHVCFDDHHDLWTFGWQRDDLGTDRAVPGIMTCSVNIRPKASNWPPMVPAPCFRDPAWSRAGRLAGSGGSASRTTVSAR
ncbi:MAG: hypothetical protein M3Y07_09650 [Acidobacteriota bacterium]|nr:hypothetical protein [Acidobacteriota bacterium]